MEIRTWSDFFLAVSTMRTAQKKYFRTRSDSALREAKEFEQLIDEAIEAHKAAAAPKQCELPL